MSDVRAGLCATCAHAKRIPNKRGSTFYLCGRAKDDPSFRKYPQLPVRNCRGYEPPNGDCYKGSDPP